jgi:hypothetical protein
VTPLRVRIRKRVPPAYPQIPNAIEWKKPDAAPRYVVKNAPRCNPVCSRQHCMRTSPASSVHYDLKGFQIAFLIRVQQCVAEQILLPVRISCAMGFEKTPDRFPQKLPNNLCFVARKELDGTGTRNSPGSFRC